MSIMYRNQTGLNYIIFSLVMIFMISSCKVLQPEKVQVSADSTLFRDLNTTDSTNISDVPWRELFTDVNLQKIIERTLVNNPDLKIAMARVKIAEANFRQSKAEFFPSLNAGFSASFQSRNNPQGFPELYQLYGSTSWEADIWGKYRSTKRANLASLLASEAYKRAVITELIASVATNYYTLLALDAQLEITQQTVEKRISNVDVVQLLKDNDVVTGADLVLSQANRYSAEVTIPDLKQSVYEMENNLCLLMGEDPHPIERGKIDDQELSSDLKAGVPAQLLANRPDVQAAEYNLRSSFEMTRAARSYFYPSLTITARAGISETDLSSLFSSPLVVWNILGGLTQPLFNNGVNRQRLAIARANQEADLEQFKKTLLTAGQEVVNAMHGYQSAADKIGIRARQIEYLEKAVDYTMELLKYTSNTNYTDVLTSEVNLLSARLNSVNDKLQQLQAIVNLYQSLGGGWKEK